MSRLATILLLLVAIGAGVFLWVFEPQFRSTRDEAAIHQSLLGMSSEQIRGIKIRTGDDSFEIDLKDDGWWIGPNPKDRADIRRITELLGAAASLGAIDVIRASEFKGDRDLDDFGLAEPKSQIDFIGDGKATLYFGKEAAVDGQVYVRLGDSRDVYIVDDKLQKLASQSPSEFRDRRLTNLTPDQVDRFVIKRGVGEIELARGVKGWEITRPLHATADDSRVEQVLNVVLGAQIAAFVADNSDDLSAYGLAEPRGEITMFAEDESRPLALRVGADVAGSADSPEKEGGAKVVAQFTGRDSVYHLPAIVWEALQVTPDSLRDKRLLSLNLDTIDAIRFSGAEDADLFERSGDGWKDASGPVANGRIEAFVKQLNDAVVSKYLPFNPETVKQAGLETPQATITFEAWLSENTPEATAGRHAVLAVKIGRQENGSVFVRVGENPEICVVPADAIAGLPFSISAP